MKETENNCSEKNTTVHSDKEIFDPSDSEENIRVFPIWDKPMTFWLAQMLCAVHSVSQWEYLDIVIIK